MKKQNRQIYRFDNFQLDAGNRQLRRDDAPLSLPPKAFDLLLALIENNGRLVEKDVLFTSVWHDQIVEESNLPVHISQIRKALGETKNNPRFIETVPGYGYRFVGEVINLEDEELVIETETLSRITIEKEEEMGRKEDGEMFKRRKFVSLSPLLSFPSSLKLAAGAIVILCVIGSIFWLSNRTQNNNAVAPVAIAERNTVIKRLTSKGTVDYSVLSPDGKLFAYSVRERDSMADFLKKL